MMGSLAQFCNYLQLFSMYESFGVDLAKMESWGRGVNEVGNCTSGLRQSSTTVEFLNAFVFPTQFKSLLIQGINRVQLPPKT